MQLEFILFVVQFRAGSRLVDFACSEKHYLKDLEKTLYLSSVNVFNKMFNSVS